MADVDNLKVSVAKQDEESTSSDDSSLDLLATTASNLNQNEWMKILGALDDSVLLQLKPLIANHSQDPSVDQPGKTMEEKVDWLMNKMGKVINYIKKNKKTMSSMQKDMEGLEDGLAARAQRGDPTSPRVRNPARARRSRPKRSHVEEEELQSKSQGGMSKAISSPARRKKRHGRTNTARVVDGEDISGLAGMHGYGDARKKFYRFGSRKMPCVLPSEGYPSEKDAKRKPLGSLVMEYAHGYNGNDVQSRDNMFLDGDNLVYYIAATGVIMNVKDGSQKFFTKHNDDISCMAIDPNQGSPYVATGQVDPKDYTKQDLPKIWIWNRQTGEKIKLLSDVHWGRVLKLGWSSNQNWLFSIGGDENHEFKIWDTEAFFGPDRRKIDGKRDFIFSSSLHKEEIFGMKLNPYPPTVAGALDELVIYGKRKVSHVLIMEPRPGKKDIYMKKKDVSFTTLPELKKNKKLLERAYLCVTWLPDGRYVVGSPSGFAYVCERHRPLLRFQAHRDMVGAICLGRSQNELITTSWDGTIKLWDYDPQNIKMMDKESRANLIIPDSDFQFKPRAIAFNAAENTLYIGSKTNQIARYDFDGPKFELIVDGHDGQVWGLATHPQDSVYVTGGYDNVLKLWDSNSLKLIDTYEFELEDDADPEQVTCCAWSEDGRFVAVGTESSKIFVFNYENGELKLAASHLIERKTKNSVMENVAYVRFSEDSGFLAVAHMDSQGYVLSLEGNENSMSLQQWKPMTMPAAPTNLQWSADGKWVKFLTRDYEVCHFELDYESHKAHFYPGIPDPDLVAWASDPLIAGWDVEGLYQKGWDGTDLNDASLSASNRYIASGDDFGVVRLHNYPAINQEAHRKYLGHSSFVVGIEFMRTGEERLITCGGNDMAIFQWRLVESMDDGAE